MLALVSTPGAEEGVEMREVAEPSPASNEVVVEVRAFSLNRGELALLANRPEGWRPGQDISGVVVGAEENGSGPSVGERVVAIVDEAGWAERVAVPVDRLAVLGEGVSFAQAAALPVAGLTALRALRRGGSLLGRRVLVTGASGGVGNLAVQLARSAGARVTAVASRPEAREELVVLGADDTVASTGEAGGRYDLILESVGGDSLSASLRALAPGGTVVLFGNSSNEAASLNLFDMTYLYPEGAAIEVFFYAHGGSFAEDLETLSSLVARGELKPRIGAEKSWRNLPEILAALRARRISGKAILNVVG